MELGTHLSDTDIHVDCGREKSWRKSANMCVFCGSGIVVKDDACSICGSNGEYKNYLGPHQYS